MLRVVSFRYIRILSVVLFVCAYVSSFAQVKKPKLVVTIVVEQMRYDYINRFLPHFSKAASKVIVPRCKLRKCSYKITYTQCKWNCFYFYNHAIYAGIVGILV